MESTNAYALAHLRELSDGDVVEARIQTAGRGRLNRSWVSHVPGNLAISLILKPSGSAATLPLANLSQLLAVCLCDQLEGAGVHPTIKWPNDVQVRGRKVAGLLAQAVTSGEDFLGLVLGLGVNLNLDPTILAGIDQPATALNLLWGGPVDRDTFRDDLLHRFFAAYGPFLQRGFPGIRTTFARRCGFLGEPIEVRLPSGTLEGTAEDIDAGGALILRRRDGGTERVTLGEVFDLPASGVSPVN